MSEILNKIVLYVGEKEREVAINDIWRLFNYDVKDGTGGCTTRNDVTEDDIIQCLFYYLENGFLISYWDGYSRKKFERKTGFPEFEKIIKTKTGGHLQISLYDNLYALYKELSPKDQRKIGF